MILSQGNFVKVAYRPMPILKSYGAFYVSSSPKLFKDKLGLAISLKNLVIINGYWYVQAREFSDFKDKISAYVSNPANLLRIFKRCQKDSKMLVKLSKGIKSAADFLKYRDFADKWWPFIMVIYGGEDYYENYLRNYLKKILRKPGEAEKYFNIIARPAQENIIFKEKRGLLAIGADIQKRCGKTRISLPKKVSKHFLKYRWLSARGYYGKEWKLNDVVLRLRSFLKKDCARELKNLKRQSENEKKLYQIVLKNLKPDKKMLNFIETTRKFLYFRTFRTDVLHEADFFSRQFLLGLCAKYNFAYEEIVNLTTVEINKLCSGAFSRRKIQQLKNRSRKILKDYVLLMINGKIRIITDKKEIAFIKKSVETASRGLQEVRGVAASPGRVRGNVRIIMKNQDVKKIKEKEIMVTTMTHPNYIIAMEKASAFVTDEGGLTCHAAIVSREMKKPCIIGTKIATKILKDGDLVEVDADEGVVRRL